MVETKASEMIFFLGVAKTQIDVIQTSAKIAPQNVMIPGERRSWIPLVHDPETALERCLEGCQEMDIPVANPKEDLVLQKNKFSALGFGHFFLNHILTTKNNWKTFRFHGDIPWQGCYDINGQPMVIVTEVFDIL
jgi:hypothetical protein